VPHFESVGGHDPEEPENPVGEAIQYNDQGPEDDDKGAEWESEQGRGALRTGDHDVLRGHLANHHVEKDHDEEGDDERDPVCHRLGDWEEAEPTLEDRAHGRLGDRTQEQGGHRDAEL
jgi:hypothetical protein